jgi:hypothetical protein
LTRIRQNSAEFSLSDPIETNSWRVLVISTLVYLFETYGMRCWRRRGARYSYLIPLIVPACPVMSCVVVRIFTAGFEELFVPLRIFTASFKELFSKKCVILTADL